MNVCTLCQEKPAVWKYKNKGAPEGLEYICDYCLNAQEESSELIDKMDFKPQKEAKK